MERYCLILFDPQIVHENASFIMDFQQVFFEVVECDWPAWCPDGDSTGFLNSNEDCSDPPCSV